MTYLKRSNPREKKSRAYVALAAGLVGVLLLIHLFFPGFFARIFVPAGSAAWQAEAGTETFFGSLRSKYSLTKENEDLKAKLSAQTLTSLMLQSALTENAQLRGLLQRAGSVAGDDIAAAVLSGPPQTPYDTLLLDVGTSDSVSVGDRVYAPGGVAIGDIAEAYAKTSKVALYSAPGRIVPALVGSSTTQVQATGRGGGNFLIHLPSDIRIHQGDVVLMPSIRLHILGEVASVELDSTESLQTVYFNLPVNIHELRFVAVDRSGS